MYSPASEENPVLSGERLSPVLRTASSIEVKLGAPVHHRLEVGL